MLRKLILYITIQYSIIEQKGDLVINWYGKYEWLRICIYIMFFFHEDVVLINHIYKVSINTWNKVHRVNDKLSPIENLDTNYYGRNQ